VAVAAAQTLVPKAPPNLTILWLKSLSFNPASANVGGTITGTVTLMRPAVGSLQVGLNLSGAQPVEGGLWALDGVVMPNKVTVQAGSDKGTFTIASSSSVTWTGTKSFTVAATNGSERLSGTFSVVRLVRR
jgi:hypothetical protein